VTGRDGAPTEVLLVDDEVAWLRSLGLTLAMASGFQVRRCSDSRKVMDELAHGAIGLVVLDLNMPHLSGQDLLPGIVEQYPEIPVVVLSGMNQIETAVECMRRGAFDYIVKTAEPQGIVQGVLRALRLAELERQSREVVPRVLGGTLRRPECFADVLTQDKRMHAVLLYAEAVATSPQPVLITGETGVGKELIARAIHQLSGRAGPLVAMNVAGVDDAVFSDTLFGHVRGAYTGAEAPRGGMIEQASGGTLFLDEIGDLGMGAQIKLLRLLQEGEYFTLGSDVPRRMNARVVVATHCDLEAKQVAGQFRKDLYYRLRAHHLQIPPLRERPGDIPVLLDRFLEDAARDLGKKKPTVPKELAILLANHPFPGNVRELRAMAYDAMTLHQSRMLSLDSFKRATAGHAAARAVTAASAPRRVFVESEPLPTLHEVVDLLVEEAMRRAEGKQSIACRLLGISQPAISKRLRLLRARRAQEP